MKPLNILVSTGLLMGVSVSNSYLEVPYLGVAAWLLSFAIVGHAAKCSFSEQSEFLDKQFRDEVELTQAPAGTFNDDELTAGRRVGMGSGSSSFLGIFTRLFFEAADNEMNRRDSSGRVAYNVKYILAFILWLPASWSIWVTLTDYFFH